MAEAERIVIVVDDLRVPLFSGALVCRTVEEGLDLVEYFRAGGEVIDELWLDHDLGTVYRGEDDVFGRPVDIKPLLTRMEEWGFGGDTAWVRQVFVHTASPVGSAMLEASLHRYGYNYRRVAAGEHFSAEDWHDVV